MKRIVPPPQSISDRPCQILIQQKCCATVWRIGPVFRREPDPLARSSALLACEPGRSRDRFGPPADPGFASAFGHHAKARSPKKFLPHWDESLGRLDRCPP